MKSLKETYGAFFLSVLAPALQLQYILGWGYVLTLAVSLFFLFIGDTRFPSETPFVSVAGIMASFGSWACGLWLVRQFGIKNHLSMRRGAWIMVLTWFIACSISALFFTLAGFPSPSRIEEFSLLRRFIDGWYESMSGFTTTGASILPSVEVFPRSVLFWRSLTHWFGGMGIAYLGMTVWKSFGFKRGPIINAEAESPNHVDFDTEADAIKSGVDFLRAYSLLSGIMFALLLISGILFREVPYEHWYDNVFESASYTVSTLGTGGFGVHDASEGLPVMGENGQLVIGGLRNRVSDWIIGIFMFFCGMNFSLWYVLLFKGEWRVVLRNSEFKVYLGMCAAITLSIWYFLAKYHVYDTIWESLRYALFNMATIVSTTGLANWDFHFWPAEAQGILFIAYLLGGSVGSTAGGLKVTRYIVATKYLYNELRQLITGDAIKEFVIDDMVYTRHSAGLITATMAVYYLLFLGGAIGLMVITPHMVLPDGTVKSLDFVSAVGSSIANLGNIGPAVALGTINAGPTGNYFAFNEAAKVLLICLMFVGRVGILSVLMIFITEKGEEKYKQSVAESTFDKHKPRLRS
jgi:trk system potassium uptake protein TrkH